MSSSKRRNKKVYYSAPMSDVIRHLRYMMTVFGPLPTAHYVRKMFPRLEWNESFSQELVKLQKLLQVFWKIDKVPPILVSTHETTVDDTIQTDSILIISETSQQRNISPSLGARICTLSFNEHVPFGLTCCGQQSFIVSFRNEFQFSNGSFTLLTPSIMHEIEHMYLPTVLIKQSVCQQDEKSSSVFSNSDYMRDQHQNSNVHVPTQDHNQENKHVQDQDEAQETIIEQKDEEKESEMKQEQPQEKEHKQENKEKKQTQENKEKEHKHDEKEKEHKHDEKEKEHKHDEKEKGQKQEEKEKVQKKHNNNNNNKGTIDISIPFHIVALLTFLALASVYYIDKTELLTTDLFLGITTVYLVLVNLSCPVSVLFAGLNCIRIVLFVLCPFTNISHTLRLVDMCLVFETGCEIVSSANKLVHSMYDIQPFTSMDDVCTHHHRTKPVYYYRSCLLLSTLFVTFLVSLIGIIPSQSLTYLSTGTIATKSFMPAATTTSDSFISDSEKMEHSRLFAAENAVYVCILQSMQVYFAEYVWVYAMQKKTVSSLFFSLCLVGSVLYPLLYSQWQLACETVYALVCNLFILVCITLLHVAKSRTSLCAFIMTGCVFGTVFYYYAY